MTFLPKFNLDAAGVVRRTQVLPVLLTGLALVIAQPVEVQARSAPDSFADLAEAVSPSVVNITTSTTVATAAGPGPGPVVP